MHDLVRARTWTIQVKWIHDIWKNHIYSTSRKSWKKVETAKISDGYFESEKVNPVISSKSKIPRIMFRKNTTPDICLHDYSKQARSSPEKAW